MTRRLFAFVFVAAVLCNKWTVERVVAWDRELESTPTIAAVVALQLGLVLVALAAWQLGRNASWRRLGRALSWGTSLVAAVALAIGLAGAARLTGLVSDRQAELAERWRQLEASEDLLLRLSPAAKDLGGSLSNLSLPSAEVRDRWFAERVRHNRVVPGGGTDSLGNVDAVVETWRIDAATSASERASLALWSAWLQGVRWLDYTSFHIDHGHFTAPDHFEMGLTVSANGLLTSGEATTMRATLELGWVRVGDGWRIGSWTTTAFRQTRAPRRLFEEVLARTLDADTLAAAQRSIHEEKLVEWLATDAERHPDPDFQHEALDRHPGLAVVDIDRDGWDDLYVMDRWGKNQLLRNRGDGTFEDVAAAYGLDLDSHCSAAVFADFDRDGDDDVFVGRTREPSLYLRNDAGKFVDASDSVAVPLPQMVSSVAAADMNGDGLLDVLFATYAARTIGASRLGRDDAIYRVPRDQLSASDADELERLLARGHAIVDLPGPPNIPLVNTGKGFVAGPTSLRTFRNTFQASFADYDGDGDQDVYLANDFAPNNLLANETVPGEAPEYRDVTAETATADFGFGMGASWGDYDGDGQLDLYVSNMHSHAGSRITAQMPELDQRFARGARGNSLFHNQLGSGRREFAHVSGLAEPALLVEDAGWSWGSQFVDVDNDGHLDVHALSGYFSVPRKYDTYFDS